MTKHVLSPQGDFPAAGLGRRLAAMFYDALLCTALLIVTGFIYKLAQMAIMGEQRLKALADSGALDGDPLFSTVVFCVLFGFFAKFWTYKGQTLGMQVWGIRVQNADGSAISIWQALLRFLIAIVSMIFAGLGFIWVLLDKQKRSWHDIYSDSQLVRIPKQR